MPLRQRRAHTPDRGTYLYSYSPGSGKSWHLVISRLDDLSQEAILELTPSEVQDAVSVADASAVNEELSKNGHAPLFVTWEEVLALGRDVEVDEHVRS